MNTQLVAPTPARGAGQHAIAVVLLTTCRASLARAVRSVFEQRLDRRIQLLIGVDRDPHRQLDSLLAALVPDCPPHVSLSLINLGYSTSQRHGGVHACYYGGSLRSALTLLADSQVVAYLDDDDWYKPDHCASLLRAIDGHKWAYAYSVYADGNSGQELCVDGLESVGVDQGLYATRFGGFVRPSALAIDKLQLLHIVHLWSCAAFAAGDGEDRLLFEQLRREPHGCTGSATVCCALDPSDALHAQRLQFMRERGVQYSGGAKIGSSRSPPPG